MKHKTTMKALTIKQPYADMILKGNKKEEYRKWKPVNTVKPGDRFLIHASATFKSGAFTGKLDTDYKRYKYTLPPKDALPRGALVGVVEYMGFKKYPDDTYGLKVRPIRTFQKPISMKGKLNFFDVEVEFNINKQ